MLGPFEFLKMTFTNGFDGYVKNLRAANESHRKSAALVVHPLVSDEELKSGATTLSSEHPTVNEPSNPSKKHQSHPVTVEGADDGAPKDVVWMTYDQYKEEIRSEYAKDLSTRPPEKIYHPYNPGPTKPDGSVNFECHCVGHMVASPCGAQFRRALTCQRAAGEAALERGECADEFMAFMRCAVDTNCFRAVDTSGGESAANGVGGRDQAARGGGVDSRQAENSTGHHEKGLTDGEQSNQTGNGDHSGKA